MNYSQVPFHPAQADGINIQVTDMRLKSNSSSPSLVQSTEQRLPIMSCNEQNTVLPILRLASYTQPAIACRGSRGIASQGKGQRSRMLCISATATTLSLSYHFLDLRQLLEVHQKDQVCQLQKTSLAQPASLLQDEIELLAKLTLQTSSGTISTLA